MEEGMRIKEHPILEFNQKEKVKFTLDGKELEGYKGSRSIKYHRPRGFFCAIGKCSACLMKVNGIPNIRTCVTKLEEGMKVETQKGKGDFN
jgi:predicted molibdopterin-dependent oxidoreductase YjgC